MKLIIAVPCLALPVCSSAQWTIVDLHMEGAEHSRVATINEGRQVGSAMFGGKRHAVLWEGTSSSWVDLHPFGFEMSGAGGLEGPSQFGAVYETEHIYTAARWNGTAQSYVSLHPSGAATSVVGESDGGQQVGGTQQTMGSDFRAALWTGTAESYVSLNPPGAIYSQAGSIRSGRQGGYASFGNGTRAGFWLGTSESFVNLHPQAYTYSAVIDISDDQEVGFVFDSFGGGRSAAVWNGTSQSFVNLYPGAFSTALGVDGGIQVGSVVIKGSAQAVLWRGTAASLVNLGEFLPFDNSGAEASDIWVDGSRAYVVGLAQDAKTGVSRATMWVSEEIAPASFTMLRGSMLSGNLLSLRESDNNRLVTRPGVVLSTSTPPVQIQVDATAPMTSPDGLSFSIESSASFGNALQGISLWDYTSGAYELLDTRSVTTTDDVAYVTVRTNPSRFIDQGTLAIRALVTCRAVGPSLSFPWSFRIDKVWWNFPG